VVAFAPNPASLAGTLVTPTAAVVDDPLALDEPLPFDEEVDADEPPQAARITAQAAAATSRPRARAARRVRDAARTGGCGDESVVISFMWTPVCGRPVCGRAIGRTSECAQFWIKSID
jgi:hypothetical protein